MPTHFMGGTRKPFAERALMKTDRRNLEMQVFVYIFVIIGITVLLMGCSTVTGAGRLMQGIGQDLEDAGEGTRDRMGERR